MGGGGVTIDNQTHLEREDQRLREAAEALPLDPFAMAAYGRFLRVKKGETKEAARWQQRAVDHVAGKLSSNLQPFITYR